MANESYNPFKMWGSYVGLGIVIILSFIVEFGVLDADVPIYELIGLFPKGTLFILGIYLSGFLIGYGIHAWIRKARS